MKNTEILLLLLITGCLFGGIALYQVSGSPNLVPNFDNAIKMGMSGLVLIAVSGVLFVLLIAAQPRKTARLKLTDEEQMQTSGLHPIVFSIFIIVLLLILFPLIMVLLYAKGPIIGLLPGITVIVGAVYITWRVHKKGL